MGIPHTRITEEGRNTVHEYRLSVDSAWAASDSREIRYHAPHIFIGASSSRRTGWLIKISRAFVQRYLISYSCSWTGFPGRFPRTRWHTENVKTQQKKDKTKWWREWERLNARTGSPPCLEVSAQVYESHIGQQPTFQQSINDRVQVDLCCWICHKWFSLWCPWR